MMVAVPATGCRARRRVVVVSSVDAEWSGTVFLRDGQKGENLEKKRRLREEFTSPSVIHRQVIVRKENKTCRVLAVYNIS